MGETPRFWNQTREVSERKTIERELEAIEGFKNLSTAQQRFMLSTLYIQQRAERGTDSRSASRIQKAATIYKNRRDESYIASDYSGNAHAYQKSQGYVHDSFCHLAAIELEKLAAQRRDRASDAWIYAGPSHSYADLEQLVEIAQQKTTLPLLANIHTTETGIAVHTTVVLGKNGHGTLSVWEKAGYSLPFHIVPLESVYQNFPESHVWRLRSLHT